MFVFSNWFVTPSPRGTAHRIPPRWLKAESTGKTVAYVVGSAVIFQRIVDEAATSELPNGSGVGGDAVPVPAPAALTRAKVAVCWTSAGAVVPPPYIAASTISTGAFVTETSLIIVI